MVSKSISAVSLLAASLTTPSVGAISFSFNAAACGGGLFENVDISVTCNGRSSLHCGFGDTAEVLGTVEATSDFSNSDVTLTACLLNYYCPADEENALSAGALCDWLVPIDDGNQTCGEAGTYAVNSEVVVPDAKIPSRWSYLATVKIGVEGDCRADGATSSSSQMTYYSALGVWSLVVAGAAACAVRKKHGDIEHEDDQVGAECDGDRGCERASPYVEMTSNGAIV
mmetsp:Transcript_34846/g.74278  ORF Transcript_34846/g.74278 Transcript_34846/m.74278 type:complete len:227 (-) Transcript_34846:193-873(-)